MGSKSRSCLESVDVISMNLFFKLGLSGSRDYPM